MIEGLEKKQDYDLLTEIYLFEKNWSLAWDYAEASSLLKKMLNIFIRTGLQEEGEELIMKVRNEFRNLPALQDEMNKAGL